MSHVPMIVCVQGPSISQLLISAIPSFALNWTTVSGEHVGFALPRSHLPLPR